ncbi:MAG: autotransporter-associated beta strand repeat-containing protein [Kiritimatiellae bacterium]|nr:autotransporter-associated beta strand repeat-containing protein [Kiritimatiellia bacterium]MBR1609858.1 autotransporter-associated beta strand repeat-containing protein [Kiritimatiellia bacterium]
MKMHKRTLCAAALLAVAVSAPAGDSIWNGGDGKWSDANWADSDTGAVGLFTAGNRAVVSDACTITIDADTSAVAGLYLGADATIDGPGNLVFDSASAAKTIEVYSGVAAKISAPIDGKVRKTGYGSLETTADNYKTLTLSANNVDPVVFEIGSGSWIVSGGSTVHVQTPSSTEGESGWYYFQGDNGSYNDPTKGAYITVKDGSTLMYSRGKSAPWTCFGPRNKNGHFELLVTGGSSFKTKSDEFRISSEQGGAVNTYFKMRAEDSTVEINSTLNGNNRNSNATKILEFVNSDVYFNKIQMKGPSSRNSVTFDGARVHTLQANASFFDASERAGTVLYHTTGDGLTLDARHDITLSTEAIIDGDGGLTKTGAKKLTLPAAYAYTGTTTVSEGTVDLTGSVAGPIAVASGATLNVTSSTQGEVPSVEIGGTATFASVPVKTSSLVLGTGARLNIGTFGNVIAAVSGYENATISFDASGWPLDTALFTSDDADFLSAMLAAVAPQISSGLVAEIDGGSIYVRSENAIKEAVWTGLGSDANWSTAGNWDAAGVPNTGDWLRFTGASNAANVDDLPGIVVQSVTFDAGSGPFSVSGSGTLSAPAWTNLSENAQTLRIGATASSAETTVHAVGDIAFEGGFDGSSAYKVVKDGPGTMTVAGSSWGGKLTLEEGTVAFSGFEESPLSSEANDVVIRGGTLDAGGTALTLRQDTNSGAEPVLQDGAVLENGTYTLAGPSGYLTSWLPGTITVGEGATLSTSCQLFDSPAVAGKRTLRVGNGGVFINSTSSERHLASGNSADTAFVLEVAGGKALFQGWGYIYFGSRQGGRRRTEVYLSDGGYLFAQAELRLGDYDGNGGSNVFEMENSGAEFATLNAAVRTDSLAMTIRNSVVTNNQFSVGNGLGADPDKYSISLDGARFVSKENNANWIRANANSDTACFHVGAGGVTLEARHAVTLSAVMDGTGGMTKTGNGTLTLATKQLYAGTTTVAAGTLVVNGDMGGSVAVEAGATLSFGAEEEIAIDGDLDASAGTIAASAISVGESRSYVRVARCSGDISLPATLPRDEDGNTWIVRADKSGDNVLCWGQLKGTFIILR